MWANRAVFGSGEWNSFPKKPMPDIRIFQCSFETLGRYTEESRESDRQTATKLGVNRMTLAAWLGGRDRPQRFVLLPPRLAMSVSCGGEAVRIYWRLVNANRDDFSEKPFSTTQLTNLV